MGPTVRAATTDDIPALQAVFRRAALANAGDHALLASHPEFLEWPGASVAEGRTRVAEVAGHVVGFATTLARGDVAELEDIFTDPDWMRRGVGRALVADLVATARARGVTRIEVDANPHALAFYRDAGFVEVGPAVLEHGVGIRMSLTIRSSGDGGAASRPPASPTP